MNHKWGTLDRGKYMLCINTSQSKHSQHPLKVYSHSHTCINAYWLAHDKATGEQFPQMRMHASVKRGQSIGTQTKQTSAAVHFLLADQAWRASRKHRKVKTSLSIRRLFFSKKIKKEKQVTLTQYQHGHLRHQNKAMNKEHYVSLIQALRIHSRLSFHRHVIWINIMKTKRDKR